MCRYKVHEVNCLVTEPILGNADVCVIRLLASNLRSIFTDVSHPEISNIHSYDGFSDMYQLSRFLASFRSSGSR